MPDFMGNGVEVGNGFDASNAARLTELALRAGTHPAFPRNRLEGFRQSAGNILKPTDGGDSTRRRALVDRRTPSQYLIGREVDAAPE